MAATEYLILAHMLLLHPTSTVELQVCHEFSKQVKRVPYTSSENSFTLKDAFSRVTKNKKTASHSQK